MQLRFEWLGRLRRKLRRKPWVEELSGEQRRELARNLRALTESKRTLERQVTGNAPPR